MARGQVSVWGTSGGDFWRPQKSPSAVQGRAPGRGLGQAPEADA